MAPGTGKTPDELHDEVLSDILDHLDLDQASREQLETQVYYLFDREDMHFLPVNFAEDLPASIPDYGMEPLNSYNHSERRVSADMRRRLQEFLYLNPYQTIVDTDEADQPTDAAVKLVRITRLAGHTSITSRHVYNTFLEIEAKAFKGFIERLSSYCVQREVDLSKYLRIPSMSMMRYDYEDDVKNFSDLTRGLTGYIR